MMELEFSTLKGKTLTNVKNVDNKKIIFITTSGKKYELYHEQDCCEEVVVEDICGDLQDLIGSEILLAEEVSNKQNTNPEGVTIHEDSESFTWTFYKLATNKGAVTIRWYGESSGYYSERVDFAQVV